jgi:hypothetical protein
MRYLVLSTALILGGCGFVEIPCGPSSCGGCCDTNNKCWPGGNRFACGAGGNYCHSCTAMQACMAGSCELLPDMGAGGGNGDTGGGDEVTGGGGQSASGGGGEMASGGGGSGAGGATGGGGAATGGGVAATGGGAADAGPACGPETCDGCCNAAGHCVSGKAHSACGWYGEACTSCTSSQTCLADCVSTPTHVGTACMGDTDCSAVGTDAYCFTAATDGYPDGYCTTSCGVSSDCGPGAACFDLTTSGAACFAVCAAPGMQSTCRSGYTCHALDGVLASVAFGICEPS